MSNNISFSYQGKSYDINLKPMDNSSGNSVMLNGKTYQILGSEEAVICFKSKFENIGQANFQSFEALENFFKNIGKEEGSQEEKIDSIFQNTIKIEEKNELKIDIPSVIEEIGEKLEKIYIYPEVAKKCREYLQHQLNKGAYSRFSHLKSFADAVSKDISDIAHDKHMVFDLRWVPEMAIPFDPNKDTSYAIPNLEDVYKYTSDFTGYSYEFKSGYLETDKDVGYLDFRAFGICNIGVERKNAYIEAANNIKSAKSIIVDIRNNGGGVPSGVQMLCSLLMEPGKHLDSIVERKGNTYTTTPWDTLNYEELPKEMRLLNRKIVVLISPKTFSAAESFANSMQVLGMAEIVGEQSGGGANPRGYYDIGDDFDIGIPHGRAFNPNRGDKSNWEGIGIKPDRSVAAEDALNAALAILKK